MGLRESNLEVAHLLWEVISNNRNQCHQVGLGDMYVSPSFEDLAPSRICEAHGKVLGMLEIPRAVLATCPLGGWHQVVNWMC